MTQTTTRTDKSILNLWWWSIDRLTVVALLILCIVGVVLDTAASPSVAERLGLNPFYFVNRHLIFLGPSLFCMFALSFLNKKTIWRFSSLMLTGTIILMVLTLFIGMTIKGATRWISLAGFSLQPSEFIKPAFAVTSAWLMARYQYEEKFPGHQITVGIFIVILCLLLLQPDFGMSVILTAIWGTQLFLSGLALKFIIIFGCLGIFGILSAYLIFPHVASRIDRFLDPAAGDNYQVQKSLDAFGHGGWLGTGPAHGQVKLKLPDAHADFVFAVAGEEFGMIAAILLIMLFCFIIIRNITRIFKTEDMFVILASAGLLVQFALQSLVHMGSSLQILPAKGMTLPFISYGGSSLLSMGISMGLLLALTRKGTDRQSKIRRP